MAFKITEADFEKVYGKKQAQPQAQPVATPTATQNTSSFKITEDDFDKVFGPSRQKEQETQLFKPAQTAGEVSPAVSYADKVKTPVPTPTITAKEKYGNTLYVPASMYAVENEKRNKLNYIVNDNYKLTSGAGIANPYAQLDYVNEAERMAISDLVAKKDYESAYRYLLGIERDLNARQAEGEHKQVVEFAKEHPLLASGVSVGSSLFKPIEYAGNMVQYATDKMQGKQTDFDANAENFAMTRYSNAVNEGVMQDDGIVEQLLKGTGMSIANQTAISSLVGAGPLTELVMAAQAAQDSLYENTKRGLSRDEAILNAAGKGVITYWAERYFPSEKLLGIGKADIADTIWKQIGKASLAEGIEEVAENVVSNIWDSAQLGDKSEFAQMVQQYKDRGYDKKDAVVQTTAQKYIYDSLMGFAGGALAGGLMGGGAGIINSTINGRNAKQDSVAKQNDAQTEGKTAEQQPVGIKEYVDTLKESAKGNAENNLNGAYKSTGMTAAQYVENNLDGNYYQEKNKLYFMEKDGKKVPVSKTVHDYAKYLQANRPQVTSRPTDNIEQVPYNAQQIASVQQAPQTAAQQIAKDINVPDTNTVNTAPTEAEKQLVRDIGADAAQQEAIKAEAINRGLGETIEQIEAFAKRTGVKVHYYNGQLGEKILGFREGNDIYIDLREKNKILKTAIHETIHALRSNNSEAYNKLHRQLDALQKNSTRFNVLAEMTGEKYADMGVIDPNKNSEEIVAKLSEAIIENPEEFLAKFGKERTFIDAVIDFLKEIKNTIVANFGGNGAEKARVDNALMALEQYLRNEVGNSTNDSQFDIELSENQLNGLSKNGNIQTEVNSNEERTDGTRRRSNNGTGADVSTEVSSSYRGRDNTVNNAGDGQRDDSGRSSNANIPEGYERKKIKGHNLLYKPVSHQGYSKHSKAIVKALKFFGLDAIVFEGDILVEGSRKVEAKDNECGSAGIKSIFVGNATKKNPYDVAGHEAMHDYITSGRPEALQFRKAVKKNIIKKSPVTKKFLAELMDKGYFDDIKIENYNSEAEFKKRIENTFLAEVEGYFSGWIYSTHYGHTNSIRDALIQEYKPMFFNFEEILDSHNNFINSFNKDTPKGVSSSFAENNGTVTNKNGDVVAVDNNGNTQFNIRTFEDGGREYLERYLAKQSDLAEEDKADILSSIDAIYNMVKEYNTAMSSEYPSFTNWCEAKPVIDDNGNVVMSVIVPNGDYKMNIDVSTVCKKRKALDVVLNKMAESGDLSVYSMSQPDIVKMNQIIKRHGFEVACSMCFVDAKRYRIGNWANSFADMYNSIVETIIPEGSDIVLDQFNYSGAKIKKVKGRKADSVKTTELRWDKVNRMINDKSVKPIMREMAKAIKINPSMRKMLSGGDLISSKGMDNLKMQNPELYKLTNRHMGTAKPKTSHSETPYTNEVLSAKGWTPEKAYAVGGVRIQSFSDYMANMFFDYAQIVADLSAKQLPGHGYTKELDFAKIFGLTGLKINMSAMPKAMDIPANIRAELNSLPEAKRKEHPLYKYYQERAGLDAKGNYLWADESIDVEEAIKLQNTEGYEKNCGIICVGISDAHIRKLMADDNMKMVIPYHKSGINPVVAKMQNIDLYTDYTNEQNTRYAKSGKKLRKNSFQFDFYADLAQTNDPRTTAENYVRDCENRNFLPKFDRFAYKLDADGNRIKGKDGKYVVDENYYKLLIDFRVYDNAGEYAPQGAIKMSYPQNLNQLVKESLKTSEATAAKMDKGIDALLKDIKNEISIKDSDRVNTKPVYSGNYDIKFDTQHSIDIGEEKGTGKYQGKSIKEISEGTISEAQQKRAKAQALLEERQQKTAKLVPEKFAREQAKKAEDGLPESVGAMKASEKNITHMVNEYGEMKPGEKPERFISMPISTDGNDRVGKFARAAAEAGVTSDKMVQAIEKAVARGDFSHEIWRDSKAIDDAVAYIEKYGYEATLNEFYKRVDNKGQITKGDMTKAMTMYAVAVENDDIKTALKLATRINKAAVNAGQVVQSVRILKKSSPENRLYFAQKSLEAYQDEVNEKYGSKAPTLVVDDSILKALKDARTEEEIEKATTELHQVIADQLPFSWSNFITSWRYLAMLGNPRTQVRNVISNAVNSVASEYVNWIQAGLEKSTGAAKSTTTQKPTQAQLDYAEKDYKIIRKQLSGEDKYKDNSLNSIERMKNPFSFPTFWGKEGDQFVGWKGNARKYGEPLMKGLTKWNELTNTAMEKGDLIFSEKAYKKALARYLKANNIDPAKITAKQLTDARAWATRQALESVFRENNQLANRISRLERNLVNSNSKGSKAGAVLIGGLMPFKSTPLNITKRAFEYTPLGIIKGIADIKTNEKVYMPAAINDIAKGLSGTSLIILGAALAKYGLLKGGLGDDKEDKMAKQMGQQSYSIDTPWFSYTLDWGGAALMPLFVGADIYESNSEDDSWLMNIVNALANAGSPIIETSMMTGMMDAIQSMSYEDVATEKLVAGLSSAMANYLGQFVPTLFGQVARAVDDTSRSSYTDVKGALKPLAKTAQKAQNKIPFLSKTNVPYMDVWGKEEKNFGGNVVGRLAYNMLSPGYVSTKSNDKVEKMLVDVYEKTGEKSVLPSNYTTYKRLGDETIRFTDKQYEAYTKAYGQTAYGILNDLQSDKGFKSMEDAYRAELISKVYSYSTAIASNDVVDKELTARQANQQKAMEHGLSAYEVFGGLIEADGMGSEGNANGTLSKSEVMAYIESRGGLSRTEKAYLFAALGNSNWKNPYI